MEDKFKENLVCIVNDGSIEDNDLKAISQPFIIGNLISENEKDIEVKFEFNQKGFNKKLRRQNVKKLFLDPKDLDSAELDKVREINPLDCLINITNRIASKKFFNFIDDGFLLLYENYPIKEFNNFLFSTLNEQIHFDTTQKSIVLSSILKSFDMANFNEIYMKIIDKNLRRKEDLSFFFLSNQNKGNESPSKNTENVKYLLKNLSVYNKVYFPTNYFENTSDQNNTFNFIDKIYQALQLLELFGSSSTIMKEKQILSVQPNFLYGLKIYYNKKHLVPRSAKITVLAFNKFFLDINSKKPSNQRSFQSFYALLRGADNELLDSLDLNGKIESFKIMNKSENFHWEVNEDLNNFNNLKNFFKSFNFSSEEVNYVYRLLALILHLGNLEFEKNNNNEVTSIKNIKSVSKVINSKDPNNLETLEKSLVNRISLNSLQKQTFTRFKHEEAMINLNLIIQNIYDKLFKFIVEKVNKSLFNENIITKQVIDEKLFKEVSIVDVSNNSICFSSSSIFNLLHFYVSEKSFELIEKVKIGNILKIYEQAKLKNSKIIYNYEVTFDNILKFFEGPKNGFLKLLHENSIDRKYKETELLSKLELNKTVSITNNTNYYNLCFKHLEGEYNFNLSEIFDTNLVDVNFNLINFLNIITTNFKTANDDTMKINLQDNEQNTFFNICINNFSNFLEENNNSHKIFVCYIPPSNFETNLDELMIKPKSLNALNQIRKMRIESYVENILNKYSKFISYKDFCIRYDSLYENVRNDKPTIKEINNLADNDVKLLGLAKFLSKALNIEEKGIFFGENGVILMTNYIYNQLEEKLSAKNKLSEKAGLRMLSIFKMIQLKKYVKNLTAATIKIQKKFKTKLVEISKKYHSICQLKIHFWILARFKHLKMKKMRWKIIKLQRILRSFIRRKIRSKPFKVDYNNWNLDEYIKNEEKLFKPTYEYGKFNISNYVYGMINSSLQKSDSVIISEFIKEDQFNEIRKKNFANFDCNLYVSSLISKVVGKIDYEKKLENEFNPQKDSTVKKEIKNEKKTTINNLHPKHNTDYKNITKINERKEDLQSKQINKKTQPKNDTPNKLSQNEKAIKAVKDTKKPQPKASETEKRKTENLNVIREEIKAEDSEKREPSSEDKILKIQGKWKSKRASKWIDILREKVFIIQRNFRKLLIKKYDLPDNYFYNEVFLRKQLEIFEKNVMENMKVLFPAIFENEQEKTGSKEISEEETGKNASKIKNSKQKFNKNEEINLKTQSKLITEKSFVNSHLKNEINKNSLIHNPYEDGKIHLFANILDIDFMVETDEVYEKLWASSYHKIFTHCLNNNSPLQLLSLGSSHTVCLSNKGKAYSFGWNNFGQCGVPVKSTIISKKDLEEETEEDKKRKSEFTVSKNLKVINKVEGMKIPQIEELLIAKSVACGEDHTLLLDHEGEVWCFGINLNGQLGLGHKNLVEKPNKLTALSKLKINTIKTEGEINFAVSSLGDAYMWPWNDKNKLRYDPLKISLKSEKVLTVSCGNNFVLLLCQSGKLYSMGKTNNYGQLGLGDTNPRYRPTLIEFFVINQERVTQISCGYKHAACKTSTGRIYTWGLGVKGQLGHGDFNNYSLPHQIVFDNNQFIKAHQVACGFRSTFFLLESRKIYFSGCTSNTFMQNYPILYNYIQKIPELKNESNYSIVRILTTWTKSFSVLYATIADSTTMKISPIKLNSILTNLASKWDNEYVDPPFIESIAGYFSSSYMKKSH